jgi:hypothetical protein
MLDELYDVPNHHERLPFHLAMAHAGLGEIDEAFQWLDRGLEVRAAFMDGVKITPAFDVLHSDPRWGVLLGRMGLAPMNVDRVN